MSGIAFALSAGALIVMSLPATYAPDGPPNLHLIAVSEPNQAVEPPADGGSDLAPSSAHPRSFRAEPGDEATDIRQSSIAPGPDVTDPSDQDSSADSPSGDSPADEPEDPRAVRSPADIGDLLPDPAPLDDLVAVGERLLFAEEFGNDMSSFVNLQTQDRNDDPGDYCTYSACVVEDDPDRPGAVRFEVRPGDVPDFGGGERSELRFPSSADVREGDERFYEFDLKFEDYPPPEGINGGSHSIVMQWHPGDVGPVFHLGVDGTGNFIVGHRWSEDKKVIGPIDEGEWHSYVVHVKHSRSADSGFVEVWRDGEVVVPRHPRATMNSSSSYLKMGIYRGEESFSQSLMYANVRITAP